MEIFFIDDVSISTFFGFIAICAFFSYRRGAIDSKKIIMDEFVELGYFTTKIDEFNNKTFIFNGRGKKLN